MNTWHDAITDPPQMGERVIMKIEEFYGEGYLAQSGWKRYDGITVDDIFGEPVTEWTEMPRK